MNNIRNFAIIAHVDHGKSTLADRLLELTGVVKVGAHQEQFLDKNPISRERGITIKLAPVKMQYQEFILNLIDTPGHVDFSYEVERTLACVEGVILLVDATQGIQAQTIAHAHKAIQQGKVIIPVVNKIDMPGAQIETTKQALAHFLGVDQSEIYEISAKTGQNVEKLLKALIEKLPSPLIRVNGEESSKSLIFDSYYDPYRGVIAFVRVFEGKLQKGMRMKLCGTNTLFEMIEVGVFTPELKSSLILQTGEIGYVVTNLKDIHLVRVGDTIQLARDNSSALSGYKKVHPMVYASLFPTDPSQYLALKVAFEKLMLNDASLIFEGIYSKALGSGIRAGFLGLLHADVVCERLEREFGLQVIITHPTVEYKKEMIHSKEYVHEPIALVHVITPEEYVGSVMRLCKQSRGVFITMDNTSQVYLSYEIPLSELITHFFDQLKTVSSGYASLDWAFKEYRLVDASLLNILLNGEVIEEFCEFVVSEKAYERGKELTSKLHKLIPRQQFEVRIQAQYKGKIIASERVAPFRKDVTGKLYGGDRSRKDKLLDRQKEGKKSMKQIGHVQIPKEVFLKLFKSST